jgi:hypothetical protein
MSFETLRSALTAKMNFASASRAGGGASRCRRQSNFKVKLLYQHMASGEYDRCFFRVNSPVSLQSLEKREYSTGSSRWSIRLGLAKNIGD